jgi:hypothetical protein
MIQVAAAAGVGSIAAAPSQEPRKFAEPVRSSNNKISSYADIFHQ